MPTKSKYPVHWEHGYHDATISGRRKIKLPPLEILKWLFRYDSESGRLYRIRCSDGIEVNSEEEAAYINSNGYMQISITDSNKTKKTFKAHHICYYIHTSEEPLSIVDHIDGDRLNNRADNLRLVSEQVNARNRKMRNDNTSGITGISYNRRMKKWRCTYYLDDGKRKNLYFDTKEEALQARLRHEREVSIQTPMLSYSVRHGLTEAVEMASTAHHWD